MNKLASLIRRSSFYHRRRTAVVCGDLRRTFAEVDERSDRFAVALVALGLGKGDRVGILLHNSCEYVEADLALIKAGLVRVPLNTRLAPEEISYIVGDSGCRLLLYGREFSAVAASISDATRSVEWYVGQGDGETEAAHLDYEALIESASLPFRPVDIEADDLHQILYTSGTTGRPKGAVTTFRSRLSALVNVYADEMPVRQEDVFLLPTAMAHGGGTKILPHLLKGARTVLMPSFELEEFCRLVQQERVTTTWLVPTMVRMLLDFPGRAEYDLASLHTVVYAAAPMPVELLRRALAEFGPVFLQVYGLSEAPNPDLVLPREDHRVSGTAEDRRLASAGRAPLFVEVRVLDEQGNDSPPGEVGEIVVRGDNVMVSYWNNPEATAAIFDREGWLHTGDLATTDEDGYVYIVDRKNDMIISGGYNIYPREVEEVLYQHPAVSECAVFGIPDPVWGESVKAVVSLRCGTGVTESELIDFCKERLASYKKPRGVDFVADLPKNSNGKIVRRPLREPYWQGMDRRV